MALPTTNLSLSLIKNTILGGLNPGPHYLSIISNYSNINKYGLNPLYVPGSDPDQRLSAVNSGPFRMGYFRGYDHDAPEPGISCEVDGVIADTIGDWLVGNVKLYDVSLRTPSLEETVIVDNLGGTQTAAFSFTFSTNITFDYIVDASEVQIRISTAFGHNPSQFPSSVQYNLGSGWITGDTTPTIQPNSNSLVQFRFYVGPK